MSLPMKPWKAALGWCVGVAMVGLARGELYVYNAMELMYPRLIYRESGMFAPGGALRWGWGQAAGSSYIDLSGLEFRVGWDPACNEHSITNGSPTLVPGLCTSNIGYVDLLIFERKSLGQVGVVAGDTRYFCCNEEARFMGVCDADQNGQLLIRESFDGGGGLTWKERLEIEKGGMSRVDQDKVFQVTETGMFMVLIANCDQRTGSLTISGNSEWVNPYGYLPGEVYGCLPFFLVLSVVYVVLGMFWMVMCMLNIQDLLAIQMWAGLVLFLGMVETGAQYFDYRTWNMDGTRGEGGQVLGIVFGAGKRALSLVLVLMVCMGYGLVRPSLGQDLHRILILAMLYFVTSALWAAISTASGGDKDMSGSTALSGLAILVFLNSLVDVTFYVWITQSIFGVISHLKSRRQSVKLGLYLRFRVVLLASVVFSVAWAIYSVVQTSGDRMVQDWQRDWTVNAIWEVLYLAVLFSVCFLLRPSLNSQRFAHSGDTVYGEGNKGRKDEGEEGVQLMGPSDDLDAEFGGPEEEDGAIVEEFVVTTGVGNSVGGHHHKATKEATD